jgi:sensor histidine kinase YesM
MNPILKVFKNFRIWSHIAFWLFFILFFWQQNPTADLQEYLAWLTILSVCAVVVYINLYFLFPVYFFQKKYFTYSLFLLVLIGIGALFLKLQFPEGNSTFASPIFQHFINLLFIVIITSSIKFLREVFRKQAQLVEMENAQLKTELSLLKSQVNPHFLFNTLNNLYGLINQNKNEAASEVTLKLSDLMRYLLESSKAEKVSLKREIQFIEDYLALEKIRLAQDAAIRFEVSGLDNDRLVSPLLFIPLIENAFKHGLQSISKKSFAHFSLSVQGDELFFEAKNSIGENILAERQSGTGISNLRKRLQLIYPERHTLEVEKTDSFFKIILNLRL